MLKINNQKGCLVSGIMILTIIWILGGSIVTQLMMWLMEQTLFEASFKFPDMRWAIIVAYIVLIGLPLLMVRFIVADRLFGIISQFWITIVFSGIFLIPGRFLKVYNAQGINLSQIIGLIISIIFVKWIYQRRNLKFILPFKNDLIYFSLIISVIISIPWVIWGSLGSLGDLFLNLSISLLCGLFISSLINHLFIDLYPEGKNIELVHKLFFGLIIFIGLTIFSTVLGQNGQQWMLVLTLPLSSWVIAALYGDTGEHHYANLSVFIFLTILISLPLVWFDPDELAMVVSSEPGEIIYWVSKSISYTALGLFFLSGVTVFLKKYWSKNAFNKKAAIISGFAWSLIILIYFIKGQSGFFGESLFIVMKSQPDLQEILKIEDPIKRREMVYQVSVQFALESQKNLVDILNQYHLDYEQYYLVNGIQVHADPVLKLLLQQRKDIDRILVVPNLRPLPKKLKTSTGDSFVVDEPMWNLEMIQANKVWEEFEVKGNGIIIGQADSGVDGNHPALRDQYVGAKAVNDYSWFDPWNYSDYPQDFSGHGTHTLGIILGKNVGIAPEAKWMGCVNLARNLGNPGHYLACMQFLFAPFPKEGNALLNGKPEIGAHIFNNSWGCPELEGCDSEIFNQAVEALEVAGVFVVSSAGNDGYYGCGSIADPLAIYEKVLSVGAIDENGELALFSSLGPVIIDGSERIKPDLVAPGVDIFSTMPNASYMKNSGTSMAGPHVVGTIALMWSSNPNLIGKIDLTKKIIESTADQYSGTIPSCVESSRIPNNAVGYGVVNAYEAVKEARKYR